MDREERVERGLAPSQTRSARSRATPVVTSDSTLLRRTTPSGGVRNGERCASLRYRPTTTRSGLAARPGPASSGSMSSTPMLPTPPFHTSASIPRARSARSSAAGHVSSSST